MKTGLFNLKTKDLATLAERVINTSQKAIYAMVGSHPLLQKLKDTYSAYDKVYAKKAFSGMGEDVAKADELQDMPFKGMRDVLHGFRRVDGLSNQQDAKDIYAVFEQYGIDLNDYSYSSENAQMKKLIETLDLPENQVKLGKVYLTEMYDMMKINHQAFLGIYGDQSMSNAELHQQQSASSMSNVMVSDLKSYLNMVEVMSGFDSTWIPLKAELNESVKAALASKITPKQTPPA